MIVATMLALQAQQDQIFRAPSYFTPVLLALLALGMAGTIAFVVMKANAAGAAAPAVTAPIVIAPTVTASPPLAAPTASATAPSRPVTPPRTGGAPTYPADHDALVPVEATKPARKFGQRRG